MLGAVTDCASDAKRAFARIHGVRFVWCVPNLLNRAVVNAFGLSIAPGSSKYFAARVVLTAMKKDVKHARRRIEPR